MGRVVLACKSDEEDRKGARAAAFPYSLLTDRRCFCSCDCVAIRSEHTALGASGSTLDVAGPGGLVSDGLGVVYIGHHLASPGATPSQGNLTLGVSSHRESTMGEPIDRRSVRLHQVCRGRRYLPTVDPLI